MSWRDHANCVGLDDMFFPEPPNAAHVERAAKKVCAECPVRQQCLDEALSLEGWLEPSSRFGVWGGLDPHERYLLFRRMTRAARRSAS